MDKFFWNNRYHEKKTGWDIGHPSTPIKEYIDQLRDKDTQNPNTRMWKRI